MNFEEQLKQIEILKRRIKREIGARKAAEAILENKSLMLYQANESLKKLNKELEHKVLQRTKDLQDSEQRYRQLVESAQDIIYRTDSNGNVTYVNPTGIQISGLTYDELLGKHYSEFLPFDVKDDVMNFYGYEEGRIKNSYMELPLVRNTGQVMWVGQQVQPIRENGETTGFVAVARDISARKLAEQELEKTQDSLRRSEEKYRGIIENLELGLLEVDVEGKIIRAYDRFCEMVGYSEEELLGQDPVQLMVPEEYASTILMQNANRTKNETGVYELQLIHKSGKKIWVIISGAPFYDLEGEVIGSIGIHLDITQRKELEENLANAKNIAEQAKKAEALFLAKMSHEIRTPLNAIIGMSHLMSSAEDEKEIDEYLATLNSSANILKVLINDILDLSKIEANSLEIVESQFDLNQLIQQVYSAFKLNAERKGLDFTIDIDSSLPMQRFGDVRLINQMLVNLLGNAIKFTDQGFVKLKIKQGTSADQVDFHIVDSGIGIEADKIEAIFEKFKQAESNISNRFGGTGLGLHITKSISNLLNGSLAVDSTIGEGSHFTLQLPIKIIEATSSIQSNNSEAQINLAGTNVLVVEDNEFNVKYLTALLKKWEVTYDVVDNGLAAVEATKVQNFKIILMDLFMPKMNGIEATKIIRKDKSNPNNLTPILGLSASAFKQDYEDALKNGMTGFLTKPLNPDTLRRKIFEMVSEVKVRPSPSPELDNNYLQDMYQGDLSFANEMFEMYLDSVDAELIHLTQLFKQKDLTGLSKQIHKMKPTFSMVGLSNLNKRSSAIRKLIEDQAEQDALNEINLLIQKIKDSIHSVKKEHENLKLKLNT